VVFLALLKGKSAVLSIDNFGCTDSPEVGQNRETFCLGVILSGQRQEPPLLDDAQTQHANPIARFSDTFALRIFKIVSACRKKSTATANESYLADRLPRSNGRSEFAQGRACLHGLLEEMGETQKVGSADDRSPIWPDGFVGSLSHSDAWIWGCVARETDLVSIGIDTELIASVATRQDVEDTVATDSEWSLVRQSGLTLEETFTLVFSAKESFYKCWHPLVKTYFDFFDVEVVALTPSTLSLKTLSTHPGFGSGPSVLKVHYSKHHSSIFTATWMEEGDESWI